MKVLVICAHPDDETLGCGGTLLKHQASNDQVFWTIGTRAHEPKWSADVIKTKKEEILQVSRAYGVESVDRLGFPAAQLDQVPTGELIERLLKTISIVKPDWVYCVHAGDVHSDHQILARAVSSVLKPMYMQRYGVKRFLAFETISSTDAAPVFESKKFVPTVFNDITPYIDRKLKIMEMYQSEKQNYPMPRAPESIRALARYRGSIVGVEYAEAFSLIREIN